MRTLSLKSYLEKEMAALSGLNSKSLYRFSAHSENNARLNDTVVLYLMLFVKEDLKRHILNKYPYLRSGCDRLFGITQENLSRFLEEEKRIQENKYEACWGSLRAALTGTVAEGNG